MTYTTNIALNPGFQNGLSGYAAVSNASISLSGLNTGGTLYGNPGLLVTTPGVIPGEGVITPSSPVQTTNNHTLSTYIQGILPGKVTVYAVANPGGAIVGTVPVTLTTNGSWQRATINNVPVSSGQSLSLIVSTTSAQSTQFWITNTQIEPDPVANAYCDGGQLGCYWLTSVGGISYQPYQFELTGSANNINASNLITVLVPGAKFNTSASSFNKNIAGLLSGVFIQQPLGLMTDFSISSLTDPDPAQTYVSWNNTGLTVPTSGYARSLGTFFPPQDYFVSNNQKLYSRAAYMAVGWQFSNVPNNAGIVLSDVQSEVLPLTTGFTAPSPSAYVLPRAIQTIIKPDRLNYCPNPSFESALTGWSQIGSGILNLDPSNSVGIIVAIDDQGETGGTQSMRVDTSVNGDGAQITLSNLIAGDQYIVSAYVQAAANVTDIIMTAGSSTTSVVRGNSGTGYGNSGYGSGYYGGNPPANASSLYGSGTYGSGTYGVNSAASSLPTNQWFRLFTTFTPTDTTVVLTISSNSTAMTSFWVDAVLVEAGQVLGNYFDGDFGTNYFWESGGTPKLARSYFYDQFAVKSNAVTNVLSHHTPLGISYVTPLFKIPYSQ